VAAKEAVMSTRTHENRLKGEKSPYLKQHAGNPVDWYPWSKEALERARKEDRPLIISIGYSSCHWCHVMEKESFEDIETARLMNENFVAIKVDREERPDLDSLYIKAVSAMTGRAGWPLTVFATPDGIPFYGGSYFPKEDGFGLPSFKKVLRAVGTAYAKEKGMVDKVTADIERMLREKNATVEGDLSEEGQEMAFEASAAYFDQVYGGFGGTTKFPHAMFLGFLLAYHGRTGRQGALSMVEKSLDAMAMGGVFDHLGGGFHRYSVDERWDVPHFEKMLYDNALLARLYAEAYKETGKPLYREVSLETLSYMLREMKGPSGGFYASQDADVAGEEGSYYLWGADEVKEVLGQGAEKFMRFYSVTEEGNHEGRNTLRRSPLSSGTALPDDIRPLKEGLLLARSRRKPPETDAKMIAAWNALALSALAKASEVFERPDLLEEANKSASYLFEVLRVADGSLGRYAFDGAPVGRGLLEDYALFGLALLDIYGASGVKRRLEEALKLAEKMVELFRDDATGLFFDAEASDELFVRERDLYDNDLPSGNSAAARLFMAISRLTGNGQYASFAEKILRSIDAVIEDPVSHGNFFAAVEDLLAAKG